MAVHETLRLHITTDKFYFEPLNTGENELLVIDRLSQDISLQGNEGQIPSTATTKSVCGIMGIIRLISGPYLIVITSKEKVGEIRGQTIWKVTGTEYHSYKRTTLHLTEKQIRDNSAYVAMLENVLRTEDFYFSTTYDVTHSLQRLQNTSPDFVTIPLHERADQRFLWNGYVLQELAQQSELSRYCMPVLLGYITIKSTIINNKPIDYILVSRRCVYRAGTRFNVRGLDNEGQVANFVETEQILQYDGNMCSFVQTRGSIPLYWSQRPNLKYMPLAQLHSANHVDGLKRHFDDQVYNYGDQVIVNLVNNKGHEGALEKVLADTVMSFKNERVMYEYFDFHHECRKMRWDRLSILINRLQDRRAKFGYFMIAKDMKIVSQQEGVFRTNCMDCLDRTNVVQGMLAKVTLEEQLRRLAVIDLPQNVDSFPQFRSLLNNIWADNADTISKQYAGTGALKTDFTRTGKRTRVGMLYDGWNSLNRYFKNNFGDGFRQDSIDLFLGHYRVEENEGIAKPSPLQMDRDWKFYAGVEENEGIAKPSPLQMDRDWKFYAGHYRVENEGIAEPSLLQMDRDWNFYTIPVIFIIAMAMLFISILLPDENISEQLMYVLFWTAASAVSLAVIYRYGTEFVDAPKLVHTKLKAD